MQEFAIWEIVPFHIAIGVVDSILCHFLVLCEMEANVTLSELVEIHICPMPGFKVVSLGLCDLKRKMAALFQATILNQLFILDINVRHQPNPKPT